MKNRIQKILGVSLTLMLALGLVAGFAVPVAAAETINEWYKFDYPVEGEDGDWFYDDDIWRIGEITEAINGDLYVCAMIDGTSEIFKSEDGARTWALTKYSDATDGVVGGWVIDMVASSIDEDVVYVVDSYYVYKTADGGDTWTFLARDALEEVLGGDCGCDLAAESDPIITSIDVAYDDDDNPFVFIGTREHYVDPVGDCVGGWYDGSVFWIGEAGYPATWSDLQLNCYSTNDYDALAVGCAPDWADSKETYVVVTNYSETHVVYTIGVKCSWNEFAELFYDCDPGNPFGSLFASRIGFPDDWEDTETLFVGIVDDDPCDNDYGGIGGDVYRVTDGSALDLNVRGITAGCIGIEPADIISLDIEGDMDEAQLIAGAFCDTNVYYSYDGGWEWDISDKDPTGELLTYVIWYDGSALAVTAGCEAAVSLSCVSDDVDDVGEAWNQISLINTYIEMVRWLSFSPGYVCEDSETMYMLTYTGENGCTTNSLFRHDGTYWERVFLADDANYGGYDADPTPWWWVEVSPDFNETNAVYVTNYDFEIFRTTDAGCSWNQLTFPCVERPDVYAMVVIDEDTVIVGGEDPDSGDPMVYKTTRHGARPWDAYELPADADNAKSFALEPGYEDPGSVLLGDRDSQVYISEDGGEEWDLVGDCQTVLGNDGDKTWVIFDPTSDIIYAAAGEVIARCVIDRDEDWADQTWDELCDNLGQAYGIAAVGDTVLYVTDAANLNYDDVNGLLIDEGGVLRSLNPDAEDEADVVFERIGPGLYENNNGDTELRELWLTCDTSDEGCAENVLWSLERIWANREYVWVYEDTLAAPVVLDMPIDGQKLTTTTEATLSWNALCGADCYEVALWSYCAECPDEKLSVDLYLDCCPEDTVECGPEIECDDLHPCTEDICIVIGPAQLPALDGYQYWGGLEPGTTYYWQVRVCQGKPYLSKWSEERSFSTALLAVPFAELCSPPCGDEDIILTPNFSWEAVDGATGYDIELATTETFTAGVIRGSSTVNAWVLSAPLDYATTYYWRVRAEKNGVFSGWTICIFTTMEAPVPAPPPVVVEPTPPAPVVPTPIIEFPPTPSWVWAIIGIGTALVVVVIVLTVRTRRPPA